MTTRPILALLACVWLYWALAVPQLALPGLHNDEAVEGALQAVQIVTGAPITAFRGAGVDVAGRVWPLMVQDYIGALNAYLAVPWVWALGGRVQAIRLYTVSLGAVSVALTLALMRRWAGLPAGFWAALLLAAGPSFVFWQRQGIFVTSLTTPLMLLMLWAGATWWKRPGARPAWQFGLWAGLGLYAKLLFVWAIGGAVGAAALFWLAGRRPWPSARALATSALAAGAGGLVGLAPFFLYNALTGGTFATLADNLGTSYYGVNNADVLTNLSVRADHLLAVMAGRGHLWYLGGQFANPWWEGLLWPTLGVLLALAWRGNGPARAGLFAALMLALGVAQSAFTVSGLFPTHFAMFTPLWPMALGGALAALTRVRWPVARYAPALVLAVVLAGDIHATVRYHQMLAQLGGAGGHTDAVYRLAEAVRGLNAPVYALDWGFAPQVRFLTAEAVQPVEIFGYTWEADEAYADRLRAALTEPGAVFIISAPDNTVFPRRQATQAVLAEAGWQWRTTQLILRRDTVPAFEIFTLTR